MSSGNESRPDGEKPSEGAADVETGAAREKEGANVHETQAERRAARRKERVLHTRVPQSLESELKGRAEQLGTSVSNLVRHILQNTFDMVEDIVADSASIARAAKDVSPTVATSTRRGTETAAPQAPSAAAPTILGWQPLLLNVNAICEGCNDILPKGTSAHVSVLSSPGQHTFRCNTCAQGEQS